MTDEPLTFTLGVHHKPYLLQGVRKLDVVVQVTAAERAAGTADEHPPAAEVIVIDTSSSMEGKRIEEARRAAAAAVDAMRDGTYFAVIAGHTTAGLVYPARPAMIPATEENRAAAKRAIDETEAAGATSMSAWLRLADDLLAGCHEARIKHAVLLTDGYSTDREGALAAALQACAGHFVCDCRGVDYGFREEELRDIAHALQGTWKPVAKPELLADDFREALRASMAKRTSRVALRVTLTGQSRVTYFARTMPSVEELTDKGVSTNAGRAIEFPLGPWGAQSCDYQLRLEASQDDLGIETGSRVSVARLEVVIPGPGEKDADRVAVSGRVIARWTADAALARASVPIIDHTERTVELNDLVWRGLAAWKRGQREAEPLLGRALHLARLLGRADLLEKLTGLAVSADPEAGVIRLRPYHEVPRADIIWTHYLSTQSRTFGPDAGDEGAGDESAEGDA